MADWSCAEIRRGRCAGSSRTWAMRRNSWTRGGPVSASGPQRPVAAAAADAWQCPPEGCSGLIFGNDSDGDVDYTTRDFFDFGAKAVVVM